MITLLVWLLAALVSQPTCPVPTGWISSAYGRRVDPISGRARYHTGLDVAAPEGSLVRLPFDVNVRRVVRGGGYGRHVLADSEHGLVVLAHLRRWVVHPGQHVQAGETIGYVGQTGRATGPHLHVEIRTGNGRRRDPGELFDCRPRPR